MFLQQYQTQQAEVEFNKISGPRNNKTETAIQSQDDEQNWHDRQVLHLMTYMNYKTALACPIKKDEKCDKTTTTKKTYLI